METSVMISKLINGGLISFEARRLGTWTTLEGFSEEEDAE